MALVLTKFHPNLSGDSRVALCGHMYRKSPISFHFMHFVQRKQNKGREFTRGHCTRACASYLGGFKSQPEEQLS
jgi:hypothetical protein